MKHRSIATLIIVAVSYITGYAQLKTVNVNTQPYAQQATIITKPIFKPVKQKVLQERFLPQTLRYQAPQEIQHSRQADYIKGAIPTSLRNKSIDEKINIIWQEVQSKVGLDKSISLQKLSQDIDDLGIWHIRFQQYINDVPIYGGEVLLHLMDDRAYILNGYLLKNNQIPDINKKEVIESNIADKITWDDLGKQTMVDDPLEIFAQAESVSKLYYKKINQTYRLVYINEFYKNLAERWLYTIDALTGEIIDKHLTICKLHNHQNKEIATKCDMEHVTNQTNERLIPTLSNGAVVGYALDLYGNTIEINAYELNNDFYLINTAMDMYRPTLSDMPNDPVGAIWTLDANGSSPQSSNFSYDHVKSNEISFPNKNAAVSAHDNGGKAYNYFKNIHNRSSINGRGGNIISLVNVADQSGESMGNAFWNGVGIFYGNGDSAFKPLARALDVAGHEMTHGVIQSTANLQYQGESGAINESMADIFGAMIERDNWLIGEDVIRQGAFPSGALRNMADPHNGASTGDFNRGWQPAHYEERYRGSEDNGGVHINSGITNHAYYLFATDDNVGYIKAEKVYYRALTKYLTSSSNFTDLRNAVIQASEDLYDSSLVQAAKKSFDEVGINGGNGSNNQTDIEVNPGTELILFTTDDQQNLYIADGEGTLLFDGPITDENPISVPSITDDGSEIVFVNDRYELWYIYIDWNTYEIQETSLNSSTNWRGATFSKDGLRLAAVRDFAEPYIFVYDFTIDDGQDFELVNPTYSNGYETDDVRYADALEFDLSGEYLLYDAYNELESNFGEDIDYWDINFMQVFESNSNTFAPQKQIQKLYNNLEPGISIGNPTFSKNSPYIIAFDYLEKDAIRLLGANIETGETGLIFDDLDGPAYPNYSIDDSKVIMNYFQDNSLIAYTRLNGDKISSDLEAYLQLGYQDTGIKWGRLFANGERVLASTELPENKVTKIYPNPVDDYLTVERQVDYPIEVQITSLTGATLENHIIKERISSLDVQNYKAGIYVIKFTNEDGTHYSKLFIKK